MNDSDRPDSPSSRARREFLTGAAAAGAALGALAASPAAQAEVQFPKERGRFGAGGAATNSGVNRSEYTLFDCEVEGDIPDDLNGAFYRVGPDAQYPKDKSLEHDIAFDGEGHVSCFRIQNSHVDYLSRWVKNDRWKAQNKARKSLYGVYRNPYTDDPSVRSLSRATQNTQVWYHGGKVLAMKEDSMPAAMDPRTLETLDGNYRFDGSLTGETFTAHPKNDSHTGNLLAFGYEAKGLGSTDLHVFEISPQGRMIWDTWVKAPYCSEIHDWAITEKHVIFLVYPLAYLGEERMKAGGVHWGWDSTRDTYLGVMRRGGDGKDLKWVKGPQTMCTHTMGCWTDGNQVFVDMDGGDANQFPFFPSPNPDDKFDPVKATGRVRRFSLDTSKKNPKSFDMKILNGEVTGGLARQDDRYHTVPYRYGFLIGGGPGGARWNRFDHQTGKVDFFSPGPDSGLSEMCFVPRRKGAPEGDGYLVGVCSRAKENGRSDLLIVDAQHLADGPVATIKLPYRAVPQVHGFWVPGDQLPGMKLFDYLDSGNGYKARLLLAQLGCTYEWIAVDIDKGETRTPGFLARNPNGRIPTLQLDDGTYLWESNAILWYLAEGTPFAPATALDRARTLQWMFFEQYSHEPYVATPRYIVRHFPPGSARHAELPARLEKGHAALAVMEQHLAQHAFFVAERYGLADIALYAYTHVAPDGGLDLTPYPAVRRWLERVAGQRGHVSLLDSK